MAKRKIKVKQNNGMSRGEYLGMRGKAYSDAGTIGALAETTDYEELAAAYANLCFALDAIDALGVRLGIIDYETNEIKD